MKFKLTGNGSARVRYSPTEIEIFAMIPASPRRISSKAIVEQRYGRTKAPYHALSATTGALNSLARKAEYNGEPFRVKKSDRAGPHPIEFWLERV